MTTKKLISANIFCVFICNGGPENLFSNLFKFSENPNNKSWFKVFFLAFLTHNKKNRVRYKKKNHIFVKKYFFWAPIMWGCLHPSFGLLFLVAFTRLYKSLSVCPSVRPSSHLSVGGQRKICWFGACFWPFWGCEGVPHGHRWVI